MAPGEFHHIGLFIQGTRVTWDARPSNGKERRVEKTISNYLGCHLLWLFNDAFSSSDHIALIARVIRE
jgi:hypothetical protein